MKKIIYLSQACGEPDTAALLALLRQSRSRNSSLDITGLLMYARGNYLQIIEGEDEQIDLLYDAILQDPRHSDVITVFNGPIKRRSYADWSMGFAHPEHLWLERSVSGYLPHAVDNILNKRPEHSAKMAGKMLSQAFGGTASQSGA